MKLDKVVQGVILCNLLSYSVPTLVYAATPLWTFSAPNPASVEISNSGTATVTYTVTNQSSKPKTLELKPAPGLSATPCVLPTKGSTCTLTVTVDGNQVPEQGIHAGPIMCQQGNPTQCYQPSAANILNISKNNNSTPTTLQVSTSTVTLSVTGLSEYGIPSVGQTTQSGKPRRVIIANTGSATAVHITYTATPALPNGTTITLFNCETVPSPGSCVLVVTPGATPSAAPIVLTISGTNKNTTTVALNILTYGSIYQGGYVFALDDTPTSTQSVLGKVVTTTDNSNGIIWSSNGQGGGFLDVSSDLLPGIAQTSSSSPGGGVPTFPDFDAFFNATYNITNPFNSSQFLECDGALDGPCNTQNILTFYNALQTNYGVSTFPYTPTQGQTDPSYYAAGICSGAFATYSDWYLPAICEMGYDSVNFGSGCGADAQSSTLQNIQASLKDNNIGSLNGQYWSSTEITSPASFIAFAQQFDIGQNTTAPKFSSLNVRCVRSF